MVVFKKGQSVEVTELLHRNGHSGYSTVYSPRNVNHSRSPPPSGLAPLRALCATDMDVYTSRGSQKTDESTTNSKQLKFGISRILSEDFGKEKSEKDITPKVFSSNHSRRFTRMTPNCPCPTSECSSLSHLYSSLSSVHSVHPAIYHYNNGADLLPGPYSILSTETHSPNQPKRKRSWSRAVFSNLQRKGLEKRFEVQKYVTKPDRRQLAAMLGLTDAQVKVWFQNRRMKWRHAQQQKEKGGENSATEDDDKMADMTQSDEDINVTEDISDVDSDVDEEETEVSSCLDQGVDLSTSETKERTVAIDK
ncbi:hypothetical protein SNE40_010328 [Patella caerulea]|uniref:Homeobox domain-containing protein n=1 Tax=Patella caerulea TaxID=87958 RepID=A0AAN8JVR4_PATCE